MLPIYPNWFSFSCSNLNIILNYIHLSFRVFKEVTSADMAMHALAPFRDGNVTWLTPEELLIATELMEQILPIAMDNTRVGGVKNNFVELRVQLQAEILC